MKKHLLFFIRQALLALVVCAIPAGSAAADDTETESLFTKFRGTFDGYVKNETAIRLHDLDRFVKIENSLELGYSKWITDNFGLTLKGLAQYDAVYDVEDDLHLEDEEEYRASVELREGFVDLTLGDLDLRLGKQQVVWGKTDGFRVTDMVNPLDYQEFVLDDFIDSRIPLWMAKAEYYFSTDYGLQFLIIPDLEFTELANAGSEYALRSSELPEGVTPIVRSTETPDETIENTEYGVKLTGFFRGWDFTLNYLYSWDDDPVVKKTLDSSAGTLTIAPEHERLNIVGATFANVFWDTVVRGEFAAKIGKYLGVDDVTDPDMVVKKTLLNYALALERDLLDITWTLQVLQETILDYEERIEDDEVDTKLTLRGTKDFLNDTLEVALFTIYGLNEEEFLIRPSVEYDMTDSTKIKVGADIFEGGDDETLFGQFDERDRLYVEVKYSF